MKYLLTIYAAILFCSCAPSFDYVKIIGITEHGAEAAFLESFLDENNIFEVNNFRLLPDDAEPGLQAALVIEILSSWEFEDNFGDILLSRSFFAPREDSLAARTNTSLEASLDGTEDIIPVEEIVPPFIALRIGGLALGDEAYPLVRAVGVHIRIEEGVKTSKTFNENVMLLIEAIEAVPKDMIQPMPEPFWVTAGGDMMLGRGATDILLDEGPRGIFGGTAEMIASSDLAMVNLEGVLSRRGTMVPKSFHFRFIPEVAQALRDAGLDVVLHANNHVFDYGETAFLDSLSFLEQAGIGAAGAGVNIEAASAPFVLERGDITARVFGLASFPRERNGWDGVTAAAGPNAAGMLHTGRRGKEVLIERMSSQGEPDHNDSPVLNIILFHGGTEWSSRPDASTRTLYTDLVATGADLVIGSHPHIVQGFEWIHGKPVFWSLGNYVFSGMQNTGGGDQGLFIRLGFLGNRLLYLEPFALTLSGPRTEIAAPENLETFYARSRLLQER